MLAFPPNSKGVDAPEPGLEPVPPPNIDGFCAPPVAAVELLKGLAAGLLPPPNILVFDVAVDEEPNILELVLGAGDVAGWLNMLLELVGALVEAAPNGFGVPLEPAVLKLNVFDMILWMRAGSGRRRAAG